MRSKLTVVFLAIVPMVLAIPAIAQCPASVPVEGAPPPGPLPLFPPDNWWNLDISAAPVDSSSASYIAFINNRGTRPLHPHLGAAAPPARAHLYGKPNP